MSSGSAITSPRLMPTRKVMRLSSRVSVLRSAIPRWTSAAHRLHDTGKLRQHSVAGVFHDPAAVFGDLGVDQFPEVGLEPFVRAFLVGVTPLIIDSARRCPGLPIGSAAEEPMVRRLTAGGYRIRTIGPRDTTIFQC